MEERTIPVLDQIVCVRLDVNIWSGQKKLTAEDLGLTPDQIPPEELAALGRKRICDPQALAVFRRLKQRGDTLLKANGVRFLDGYAIPKSQMVRINEKLDDLGEEFREAKDEFLSNYDNSVESWIARHHDWMEQLRKAIEPAERVAASLNWRRSCFRVVHPEKGEDPGLTVEVNGLGGQLMREVAQEAKETFEESYKDKTEVTRKALRPLNRMYQKMLSLSFLEPRVRPFLDLMIGVIHQAASQPGRIEGQELQELTSLLLLLTEPGKILAGTYPVFRVLVDKNNSAQPLALELDQDEPDADEAQNAEAIPATAPSPAPVEEPDAGETEIVPETENPEATPATVPLEAPPVWFF